MPSTPLAFRALLLLHILLATMGGVAEAANPQDKAERLYQDALSRYDKEDFSGAIIQLKNALQADPQALAAQALLGRAYLASGQPDAAEEAFERALKLGVHPSELAVPMAQALLDQGKGKELLGRFTARSVSVSQRPELLLLRGHAYKQSGDLASARREFEEALTVKPGFVPALRSEAELLIREGRTAEAVKFVGEATRLDSSDSAAWFLKGLTSQAAGDIASAMTEYARAIELSPGNYEARLARAWLWLEQGRREELETDVEYLSRDGNKDPRLSYLRANYFEARGDSKRARAALQEVAETLEPAQPDVLQRRAPQLLLIGGLAHYGLGRPERARDFLQRYVQAEPRNLQARRLLASILLSLRDFSGALQKLEELEKLMPNDPQLLALMAAAYMGRQRPGLAVQYLDRALALSGSAPQVHATLGIGLLRSGQTGLALDHLRKAFDKDPSLNKVGLALTVLYIRQKDPKNAIQVAEKVVQRAPGNAAALNLLGVARIAVGDRKRARAAYTAAIQADKSFTPPRLNLGKLEFLEGNASAARNVFLAILKEQPKDIQPMYELGVLEANNGQFSEAVHWLEKLRAINPHYIPGALYLLDVYIRSGQAQKAVELGKNLEELAPRDLSVLAALGRAHLNSGDLRLAQAIFSRMAGYAEFEPEWQLQIAQFQLLTGNLQGAAFSLNKALAGRPDFLDAEVLLAETDLRGGQSEAADLRARAIQRKYPRRSAGDRLIGDVALSLGKYDAALASYRSAISKEPTTDNALRLYWAYIKMDAPAKATELMEAWLKDHPRDFMAMRALADAQLRGGYVDAARDSYEAILKVQGEDGSVLNNLATILEKKKDPKALDYAQRAFRLAPSDPAIQDTLGWLLVARGESEAGLRHLREARLRDPANPEIRYHLASALARAGHEQEARVELEVALTSPVWFNDIEDARRLASRMAP
jgi:putative PEP-CTERM system TPR-repeat lipoprotein